MKKLNEAEAQLLRRLTEQLRSIASEVKLRDLHRRSDLLTEEIDPMGLMHLLIAFTCLTSEQAKEYRNVFNKRISKVKKDLHLDFSNNSFIHQLFFALEELNEHGKIGLTLVGHGVPGINSSTRLFDLGIIPTDPLTFKWESPSSNND